MSDLTKLGVLTADDERTAFILIGLTPAMVATLYSSVAFQYEEHIDETPETEALYNVLSGVAHGEESVAGALQARGAAQRAAHAALVPAAEAV
jgi:hypothetical protein